MEHDEHWSGAERLEEMKRAYQSVPVPEELDFRVRSAMARAWRRARLRRGLRRAAGMCAAALLTVTALANSGPGVAGAMEQIPLLGAITRVVTFRSYEDRRGELVGASVDVPEVENGGALNDEIKAYTDAIIAEYEKDAAVMDTGEAAYQVDLSYTVATDNDSIFALRFNKTVVMANGVESVRIYDVDKRTGRILKLGDLFRADSGYLDVLTAEIQRQMRAQMDADEGVIYWLDGEVEEWNFTALNPDAAFYVNADGELVIVFNEGDVAPMYMGVTEFAIPAEATADIAVPGYLG